MLRKILPLTTLLALLGGIFWWFTQSPPQTHLSASPHSSTVLLIPGHGGGKEGVTQLASLLEEAGFTARVVDIGDGGESINIYAEEVARQAKGLGSVTHPRAIWMRRSAPGFSPVVKRRAVANLHGV